LVPPEVREAVAALLASGATLGRALGAAARTQGAEALQSLLAEVLDALGHHEAIALLDEVGATAPDAAQLALTRWGMGRRLTKGMDLNGAWVTALPEGMAIQGNLNLQFSQIRALPEPLRVDGDLILRDTPIATLPDGLVVGANLWLEGSGVVALPKALRVGGHLGLDGAAIRDLGPGLTVGKHLQLRGCPNWNGRISAKAWVGGLVFTDRHPNGIRLELWRRLHPESEGADQTSDVKKVRLGRR
jgi:hypothetical protein